MNFPLDRESQLDAFAIKLTLASAEIAMFLHALRGATEERVRASNTPRRCSWDLVSPMRLA